MSAGKKSGSRLVCNIEVGFGMFRSEMATVSFGCDNGLLILQRLLQ